MNTASANLARAVSALLLSRGPRTHASRTSALLAHGNGKRRPVWETSGTLETRRTPHGSVATCPKIPFVVLSSNVPSPIPVP